MNLGALILITEAQYNQAPDVSEGVASAPSLEDDTVSQLLVPALASLSAVDHVLAFLVAGTAIGKRNTLSDTSRVALIDVRTTTIW